MSKNIFITGNGAWGQALAITLTSAGHDVTLWGRSDKPAPNGIKATNDLSLLRGADYALLVTPAQSTRAVLPQLQPYLRSETSLILCSKGLELSTGLRQSEIAQELLPQQRIGILSGPNFASEIARGLPAATVIAAGDLTNAERYAADLATPNLRPYASDDVIGVELCGALKNVLAIGAGLVIGAGLGENARAALITRGLTEITRLGLACGAKPATFVGLAGIGDVLLTCSSTQSRNFAYGHAVGAEQPIDTSKTVEGLPTIKAALRLAAGHGIDLPITEALHHLLYDKRSLDTVLQELMARPLKSEMER